jgi:hypothetical protein
MQRRLLPLQATAWCCSPFVQQLCVLGSGEGNAAQIAPITGHSMVRGAACCGVVQGAAAVVAGSSCFPATADIQGSAIFVSASAMRMELMSHGCYVSHYDLMLWCFC